MSIRKVKIKKRYYDKLAAVLPEFAPIQRPMSSLNPYKDNGIRGISRNLIKKVEPKTDQTQEEFEDVDYERMMKMTLHSRLVAPIRVSSLPVSLQKPKVDLDLSQIKFIENDEEEDDMGEDSFEIFENTIQHSVLNHKKKPNYGSIVVSNLSSAASSARSTTSNLSINSDNEQEEEINPKYVIKIDKTGFPEIPPLATNLVDVIDSIPESPPVSLSPYTFNEEVVTLHGEDFNQYLDEDTLFIKSALYGMRFNDDSLYEFITACDEEQYDITCQIVPNQYLKIAKIANLVRELLQYENAPDAAARIEEEMIDLFSVKDAMVWLNIPSAKMLVCHSRLMKYPHGVGFVGIAAKEKRQVVASDPTHSRIYSEKYDLPFCEDSILVLAQPITDPGTDELYAVIYLIDKVNPSGACYPYWPNSELVLLSFFTESCYKVFKRINQRYMHTEKMYKRVAKFVQSQLNLFRLIQAIQSNLQAVLNCEKIDLYFQEGKNLYTYEFKQNTVSKILIPMAKSGIAGYVFEHSELLNIPVASEHPSFYNNIDGSYSTRPLMALEIPAADGVRTILIARGKKDICFTSEDVSTLQFLSAGAASALQMSRQYRAKMNELNVALRAQDRLATLLQVAESLSRETNIDTLVGQILTHACQLVNADRASLFVLDDARKNLITKVAHGTKKPFIIQVGQGIVGTVATTGEVINIPDCYEDSRFNASVDKQTGYHTRSMMTIPVRDQNHNIIAVTQLMNKKTGEPFSDSDVELTKALCVFTGIALANSNVIDMAISSSKRVQAMLNIVTMLTHGDNVSGLLHHIMSTSRDLLDADRCSLFIVDTKASKMTSTVVDGQKSQIEITIGKGIVGAVAANGTILNIPDAYKDKRFHSGIDQATGYRTRSILAVPVKNSEGKILGVVEMINKNIIKNGGTFTSEDEKLATAFAIFTAVALEIKNKRKAAHTQSSHALAIMLSNMMDADESNSCEPPKQIVLSDHFIDKTSIDNFLFDINALNDVDQTRFIATLFYKLGFSKRFNINNGKLIRFLLAVHDEYTKHPYYNWSRVVDSTQFVYYVLKNTDLGTTLTDVEKFSLFIASICHDMSYQHEDGTEDKAAKESTEVALSVLYHNKPVEEVMHCQKLIEIISCDEEDIFADIQEDEKMSVWKIVLQLIQGTSMSKHFQLMTNLQTLIIPNILLNMKLETHRILLAQMVLKASDVSYTCRSFQVCQRRGVQTYKMFSEKNAIGKLFVRYYVNSQIGFIVMYSEPMFRLLSIVYPSLEPVFQQVKSNLSDWLKLTEKNV